MTPARHPRAFTLWAGPLDGLIREIRPTGTGEWAPLVIDATAPAGTGPAETPPAAHAVYRYVPATDRYEYERPVVV